MNPVIKERISTKIIQAGIAGGAGYRQWISSNTGFELAFFTQNDLLQLNSTGSGNVKAAKKVIQLTAFRKFK